MAPDAHIVKSFDDDLQAIESLVLAMAGLVESEINECVDAILRQDLDLVDQIRAKDKKVDQLELDIDNLAIQVLAQRQPLAQDLRAIVSVLKVTGNLERIGDLAKNVAKRANLVARSIPMGSSSETLKRMSALVQDMVRGVMDAYIGRDVEVAKEIRLRDEQVDLMHNTLFRELLTYMMEDPRNITPCMHLLFIAKNFERMGDHVTNIAEQVHYLVVGTLPEDDRPKRDETSYISVEPVKPDGG